MPGGTNAPEAPLPVMPPRPVSAGDVFFLEVRSLDFPLPVVRAAVQPVPALPAVPPLLVRAAVPLCIRHCSFLW